MNARSLGRIVLILSVSFLAGCSPNQGEWSYSGASHVSALPEDAEEWTFGAIKGLIIETAHYRVYTTVQDALLLEKLPSFLEATYRQYMAFFPEAKADESLLDIYLFGQRSEWERYTRENMGASAETILKIRSGGYSHNGTSVVYLLNRYGTFGVLAHEGFHQFVNSRLAHRIPAWMEEGLACNFEAHFWRAGKPEFTPDLNEFRIKALQKALRDDSLFPLPELLTLDSGQAVSMPVEKTATFYAQSWALTRYLQEARQEKYRPAFRQMLADASGGANLYRQSRGVEIFENYFQDDLDALWDDFVWYAQRLTDRKVEPGSEVVILGSGQSNTVITITAEQIEQAEVSP